MRRGWVSRELRWGALLALTAGSAAPAVALQANDASATRVPVLVELFTSEGCSSCPPADQLLSQMDTQPFPTLQFVVLAEHVDYWDHDGWRDVYSSPDFTQRQKLYEERLNAGDAYTPQMVIDGLHQVNGTDRAKVSAALNTVTTERKTPVTISAISADGKTVSAHVASPAVEAIAPGHSVKVLAALALSHAETDVKAGENSHKHLTHTAVARSLTRVASLQPGEALNQDVKLKIKSGTDLKNLRLVVFLQDEGSMRVYGAAMHPVE